MNKYAPTFNEFLNEKLGWVEGQELVNHGHEVAKKYGLKPKEATWSPNKTFYSFKFTSGDGAEKELRFAKKDDKILIMDNDEKTLKQVADKNELTNVLRKEK